MEELRVVGQRGTASSGDDLPVHEHHCGVGDREHDGHVLLDQQHAHAEIVGNPPDNGGELIDDDRRQSQAHLVDEQEPGATGEGSGDGEHLLFAAGQEVRPPVCEWSERGEVVGHVRRLEQCRRDLLDPGRRDVPVSTVAARCGLPNPAHFSRAFRAAYGLAPAEYRQVAGRPTSR
jgi:hypothetical protein